MSKCDYGCPQQDINKPCDNCGHPKSNHISIHPHPCLGKFEQGQSPKEQCFCTEFKSANK